MSIWRVKPVSAFEADMKKSQLKRVLGKWSLTAIGIGAIIGGGIFVLTGTGAYNHAGPALALSFVIAISWNSCDRCRHEPHFGNKTSRFPLAHD